jgi:hypothetical protein
MPGNEGMNTEMDSLSYADDIKAEASTTLPTGEVLPNNASDNEGMNTEIDSLSNADNIKAEAPALLKGEEVCPTADDLARYYSEMNGRFQQVMNQSANQQTSNNHNIGNPAADDGVADGQVDQDKESDNSKSTILFNI